MSAPLIQILGRVRTLWTDFHTEYANEERPAVARFFDPFRRGFATPVASPGFDEDQHGGEAGLRDLDLRGEFEQVGGYDSVIVVCGRQQQGRIVGARLDVV